MAHTVNDIKAEIGQKGEEITQIAHQIEDRIEEYVDWKGIVQKQPLTSVAASVGVGLLFAGALNPVLRFAVGQLGVVAQAVIMAFVVEKLKEREEQQQEPSQYVTSGY
jgi:hypothetical protein